MQMNQRQRGQRRLIEDTECAEMWRLEERAGVGGKERAEGRGREMAWQM